MPTQDRRHRRAQPARARFDSSPTMALLSILSILLSAVGAAILVWFISDALLVMAWALAETLGWDWE